MMGMMCMTNKSYLELIELPTFQERFNYLKVGGFIGEETFGYNRYLNQALYRSAEWKRFRRDVILRDKGCDLATDDYEIHGKVLIHHINPITVNDILKRDFKIFDLNNVVCCSLNTHNAIHYSDENLLTQEPIVRTKNDTCPWKQRG